MQETDTLRALLRASAVHHTKVINELIQSISQHVPCYMCSLWKLNLSTGMAVIHARGNYNALPENRTEFAHKIEGGLIGYVIEKTKKEGLPYLLIPSIHLEPFRKLHCSPQRVDMLGLKAFVSVPIPNISDVAKQHEISAVLDIYPLPDSDLDPNFILMIRDQLSLALSRACLLAMEDLTVELMEAYERRGKKDFASVLYPIINAILPKYVPCEGCSIFIWDTHYQRLNLAQTTGLLGKPKKGEVIYYLGEGLTGTIAEKRRPINLAEFGAIPAILDDINYSHKWQEDTKHRGESFLGLPIMSPSRPEELIGVIRFTNRLSPLNSSVITPFIDDDIQIIGRACSLLALYMEQELGEQNRSAFVALMAHEVTTPANAIRGSASRLIDNWSDDFVNTYGKSYVSDILDHAELQLTLTKNAEFLSGAFSSIPRAQRYQVSKTSMFRDVLQPSKKIVVPMARKEELPFEKIIINGNFPELYVDPYAFQQIFFNLLTNAIKYRRREEPEAFAVNISYHGLQRPPARLLENRSDISQDMRGYYITVDDNGIGINDGEASKIFLLGYRMKGVEKFEVRGLGIGLTVAKIILSDFSSLIWVQKNRDPTRFSIWLNPQLVDPTYATSSKWGQNEGV